ncbi:hypothetical protein F5883DRAFT_30187 [Diaporthe sp. PMI_573]|nr:hypothetical protein F5883DRAFT_30187 [Diaporthaceae sp. PMI_573]
MTTAMYANSSLCLTSDVSASPILPESGRPNKRVSRKARRGPDSLCSPLSAASGTFQHWPPLPFQNPQPRSRRQGPTAAQERSKARRRGTADGRAEAELGGSRGTAPREEVVGCCSCQILRVRVPAGPRRSHGDRPVGDRHTKGSGGQRGLNRGGRRNTLVGQLVKRYCGEIGSQAWEMMYRHRIPRDVYRLSGVGRRDRLVRRRPCQQMTQRQR